MSEEVGTRSVWLNRRRGPQKGAVQLQRRVVSQREAVGQHGAPAVFGQLRDGGIRRERRDIRVIGVLLVGGHRKANVLPR